MLQNGSRYNNALIIVHWLTFMLIVLSYASIEGREFFERGTQMRDNAKYTHFVIGLSILLTTFARIIFRLTSQVPASLSSSPKWITKVSKFGHFVIYLFLLVMPILGWLIISAEGKSVDIFGMTVPLLIGEDHELAKSLEEIHETIGTFGYALLAGHILMALYHQYILKQQLFNRMKINRS
ncbi:MAG: cytochrome b561 [Gammaproteobacteria bacterium]|jgi:cytochrome b561